MIQDNSNDGSNSIQEGGTSINQSFSVLIFKENKATIGLNKAVEARSWFQRNLLSNYSNTTSIMHGFALMLPTNQETNRKTITKYVVAMPQLWEASVNTILTSVASSTMKGKQIHSNIDKGANAKCDGYSCRCDACKDILCANTNEYTLIHNDKKYSHKQTAS